LQVREELKLRVVTYDVFKNEIDDERDWKMLNITTSKLSEYGNWTWTV